MQATSVLLTCAGQRVDMVEAFRRALAEEGRGGVVVACDLNPLSPALYSADVRALAPPVSAPDYIPTLLELVREHAIRAVLPLTDLDQRILIDQREAFAQAGATVVASPSEVCDRCADKHDAARFFVAHGIPSPRTWLPEDLPPYDELRFPVLVKSRRGFGSRDIYRCRTIAELEFFLGYTPVPSMVQEVCGGDEFSIDVLCDLEGRCVSSIPRSMIESKGGESIKGRTLDDADLVAFGALVAETLPIHGPATIQCFRTGPGRHEVTDVNPRFGGAFPLPLAAGGAYPSLVLALARGEQLESRLGAFRPGVVMTRYLSHVALVEQDGTYEPLSAAELPAVS